MNPGVPTVELTLEREPEETESWEVRVSSRDLSHAFDLFAGFVVRAEALRYRLQRGIELYEGMFYRGVLVVTGPAFVFRHCLGCSGIRFKTVVRPFVGISGGIFYFNDHARQIGLKVSLPVNRAVALGVAFVDH